MKAKASAKVRAWMGWENGTTSPIKMTMYEILTNKAPIKTTSLKFFGGVVIILVAKSKHFGSVHPKICLRPDEKNDFADLLTMLSIFEMTKT